MAAAASRGLRLFGAVRGFRGFTPRPDPFEELYAKGLDKSAQKKVQESLEIATVMRLSKFSNGVLGNPVDIVVNGQPVSVTKREKNTRLLPRFKLVDQFEAEQILANTASSLSLEQRRPEPHVLPESKELRTDGRAGNKRFDFVFVDSSSGHDYSTRPVLIREKDGKLRTAEPAERDRFLLAVFPDGNKKLKLPAKFDDANLPSLMAENAHAEILDEVCDMMYSHQPEYVRVHRAVYEDVESRQIYSVLQDTVHFRDFFLYLIRQKRFDALLCNLLEARRLDDALAVLGVALNRNVAMASLQEYVKTKENSRLADALASCRLGAPRDQEQREPRESRSPRSDSPERREARPPRDQRDVRDARESRFRDPTGNPRRSGSQS